MKQNRVFYLVGRGEAEQDVLSSGGGGGGEAEHGVLPSREGWSRTGCSLF